MTIPHATSCQCIKCQLAHSEPVLVATEYRRKTGKAVVDTIELSGSGNWIVNYHWVSRNILNGEVDWMTIENWNKQCRKEVETA